MQNLSVSLPAPVVNRASVVSPDRTVNVTITVLPRGVEGFVVFVPSTFFSDFNISIGIMNASSPFVSCEMPAHLFEFDYFFKMSLYSCCTHHKKIRLKTKTIDLTTVYLNACFIFTRLCKTV